MGLGNRGTIFENLINYTNEMYLSRDIAIVNKRPTPVKVVTKSGNQVTKGYFEKKSTVDYDGLYKSRRLDFEAKEIASLDRFDLNRVEDHQYTHLERSHKHGSISFVVVHFSKQRKTYLLPFMALRAYKAAALKGGRKSMTLDDFEVDAYEIPSGQYPVNYLAIVDKIWFADLA